MSAEGAATVTTHLLAPEDPRVPAALEVMAHLRDHLDHDELVARHRAAAADGYQLVAAFAGDTCVAVAGFHISTNLWLGRHCYVDDLVTAGDQRSVGHGRALHAWLRDHAAAAGCTALHLDSGTQRTRAHRFYLREGHDIVAFHFLQRLPARA